MLAARDLLAEGLGSVIQAGQKIMSEANVLICPAGDRSDHQRAPIERDRVAGGAFVASRVSRAVQNKNISTTNTFESSAHHKLL